MRAYLSITMNSKNFRHNVQRSLREQWTHIEHMLDQLPGKDGDDLDYESLSTKHKGMVNAIYAIEEEWIVDPEIREELSVLRTEID